MNTAANHRDSAGQSAVFTIFLSYQSSCPIGRNSPSAHARARSAARIPPGQKEDKKIEETRRLGSVQREI
ncbi:MAG: hypothetical protein ACF788_11120, partial [Novipirellula sp. JB048]